MQVFEPVEQLLRGDPLPGRNAHRLQPQGRAIDILQPTEDQRPKLIQIVLRRGGTEETHRKTPLPKVFSAKTLRLCDSVVGVSAFILKTSPQRREGAKIAKETAG